MPRPITPRCDGASRAREFLEVDRLVTVRRACAAKLLRPGQPRVAGVTEPLAPLAVGVLEPAAAPLPRGGGQVVRDELTHLLPECRLVDGVVEVHDTIL